MGVTSELLELDAIQDAPRPVSAEAHRGLSQLLLRGGFPELFLADAETHAARLRRAYGTTLEAFPPLQGICGPHVT